MAHLEKKTAKTSVGSLILGIEPCPLLISFLVIGISVHPPKPRGKKGFESIFDPFSVLKLVFKESVKSPGMLEDVPHRSKFHR
ncbi:hypothetical protein V6N13_118482 [Hibiscus sabdariffa]|uniref:Uncharacterized protein n=1 Tax=Hibiscus sabdariffa TaxID=183260 RepID=A0ABR2BSC0_9ROSI